MVEVDTILINQQLEYVIDSAVLRNKVFKEECMVGTSSYEFSKNSM